MHVVEPLRATTATVRVEHEGEFRKVFKIGFLRSDGSLWLSFPYFRLQEGIMAQINLPPGSEPMDADLRDTGRVTAHLVKYSHHTSGLALFSQSGKIRSEVRKQSVPIAGADGHVATLQVQDLTAFAIDARTRDRVDRDAQRGDHTISAQLGGEDTGACKFVVQAFRRRQVQRRATGPTGAVTKVRSPDGTESVAALLSPLPGNPGSSLVIMIGASRIPPLWDKGAALTFIGGFDAKTIVLDHSRPASFLALMYPTSDYGELRRLIGTVDLI